MTRLTGVLAEIAAVAGEAAALSLAASCGGVRVYIPAHVHDEHWLVACVGRLAADKICAHFAADGRGTKIDLPLGPAATHKQLQREIARRVLELDQAHHAARSIARTVGVTQRTVYKHRARHRGRARSDRRQGSLF